MWRKLILSLAMFWGVLLLVAAGLVYRASPGPDSQEILGLAIGSYGSEEGIVYISGRRLDCVPNEPTALYNVTCTIPIAGETLEVQASRNPPSHPIQLGGKCRATYAGKQYLCDLGSRHVHVHWFAYVDEPLGLSASQMDTLRRTYFIENLPQEMFLPGSLIVAIVTLAVASLAGAALLWARFTHKVLPALAGGAAGLALSIVTLVLSLYVTNGLWD